MSPCGSRVEAVSAVRLRVVGAATAHVEAVTMLSQRAVTILLRLKPGEVVPVTVSRNGAVDKYRREAHQ